MILVFSNWIHSSKEKSKSKNTIKIIKQNLAESNVYSLFVYTIRNTSNKRLNDLIGHQD
jgi:hypothetical protein